jgi:hypothetical protein
MCDCALLSEIRKRARFHEEQAKTFQRMLLVYDEDVSDDDDESESCSATEESEPPETIDEHVCAVATTDGASPCDMIKNSALYRAIAENGYWESYPKFLRDVQFLRTHPEIGVVRQGANVVYSGLKWL